MTILPSVIFLTMQTSASGSYWRLISAIARSRYVPTKPVEMLEVAGRAKEIPDWRPEPLGKVYMYNTPHIVNPAFNDPAQRLIINFRDPRDLLCNLYHWVFEHPVLDRPADQVAAWRAKIAAGGIDNYVRDWNAFVVFDSLRSIEQRLQGDDPLILKLSYAQMCLDFDSVVERLIAFLGVRWGDVRWDLVERERAGNLSQNPAWIGNMWKGTDIMPGRHRNELKPETLSALDEKFRDTLKFLRRLEAPAFRHLLATAAERSEMERVLVGRSDELFLRNDADDTVAQMTGRRRLSHVDLFRIGLSHRARQQFGEVIGGFTYAHAIIPAKEVGHRHLLPAGLEFEAEGSRPVRSYFDAGLSNVWRPFYEPDLLAPKGERRFFPRTDSQWSHAGALMYLQAFLDRVDPQKAARLRVMPLRWLEVSRQGDLGDKIELPPEVIELVDLAQPKARIIFDNGISDEGRVVWCCNEALRDGGRALVLQDGSTESLCSIIAELFSEAVFVYGTVFDYDFVRELAPQSVICLQAERFFPRRPDTGGDLLTYVAEAEAKKRAPRQFREFWETRRAPAVVARELKPKPVAPPEATVTGFGQLLALGKQVSQQQDWPRAAVVYAKLRERFAIARDGWLGGARAARQQGHDDAAEALLDQALARFPSDREVLAERALLMQVRRNWTEAVARWQMVTALAPDFDGGYVGQAQCLRAAGRLTEAQAALDAARDTCAESLGIWVERGRLAAARRDWAAALEAFEAARRLQPGQANWVAEVMEVLSRQQNFAAAEALAVAEMPRFPDRPEIGIQQAQIANSRREFSTAVGLWSGLRARFPDNVRILSGLAEAYAGVRDEVQLVAALKELLARSPGHVLGTLLYAGHEQRQGRAAAALARLEAAVARNPHDRQLTVALADAKSRAA